MDDGWDVSALMGRVARALLGEENARLSTKTELRFGTNGSLSVDLEKGVWFDHEAGVGGGVMDLIKRYKGLEGAAAIEWLERERIKEVDRKVVPLGNVVAEYNYEDEDGSFAYQVVRLEPKTFRQRHRNGNGDWVWKRGEKLVPYHLPELLEAVASERPVFIVEGEKDADNLRKLGLVATTNSGGAGNWHPSINKYFAKADIIVIGDNDPVATDKDGKPMFHKDGRPKYPGQDHANEVCAQLRPIAKRVRYLDLKKAWPACPDKGDISDWLAANGSIEILNVIVEDLADWTPDRPMALGATFYIAPDPASIPRRAWLHGGHYIRDVATATVAPGGWGKTTLTLFEALTMIATGLRVWYISGEDPKVEIDRRIAAHCIHHNWIIGGLPGKLFVDDKSTFPLYIARSPRTAAVIFEDDLLGRFEAAILRDQIDVIMLDPFVSFHAVPENDNGAIDAVCKRLGMIAYRTHSCIEISHHVRKQQPGQVSITVDDTRGGGAIVNAVRSSRVINRMSEKEAETAGVSSEDRSSHIRLDRGKRNMAPADAANWYRIVSVLLPNGDNVQSLEEWAFPTAQGTTKEDEGWVRMLVHHGNYRADNRSPDWLGHQLFKHFKLKKSRVNVRWVKATIAEWLESGVIDTEDRIDEHRHSKTYYIAPLQEAQDFTEPRSSWDEENGNSD